MNMIARIAAIVLVVLGSFASAASAQEPPSLREATTQAFDWKPVAAVAGARVGLDTLSSARFKSNGCTEREASGRRADGTFNAPKALAWDGAIIGATALALYLAHRLPHTKTSVRLAKVGAYVTAVGPAWAGVKNFAKCGW